MDPDPGGPKTCGSGGSGSTTLLKDVPYNVMVHVNCSIYVYWSFINKLIKVGMEVYKNWVYFQLICFS